VRRANPHRTEKDEAHAKRMTRKITLETLAKQIAEAFAKQGKEIKDLTESVAFVVKHMATKEDIAELRHELKGDIASVQTQVNSIERHLPETKTEIRLGNLEEEVFGDVRR
jgi:ABC-type transporter Mla subunit MlaD